MTRDDIENYLRAGGFKAALQPIVDTKSGRTHSYEILARLQTSQKWISPLDFINIAENYNIGHKVSLAVLSEAVEHFQYAPVKLNINFSPNQLCHPDTFIFLEQVIEAYSYPRELITIEITEGKCTFCWSTLINQINEQHQLGWNFSLDDFGAQQQTFKRFVELPISQLKVDKYFLPYSPTGAELKRCTDQAGQNKMLVLRSLCDLTQRSNIELVCEGVETKLLAEVLSKLGVRYQQGFFHARPALLANSVNNSEKATGTFGAIFQAIHN